ncbi:scavenger receptor cysteine-rich domain superfamily protein-like [Ptychodera flava]|uniref:scavenger receptor cysteine-rich domain superfamily protein-like n=1 Tax=Ptychodera flava TaxID=63121 RepID=UPI00396A69DA
MCSRSVAVLLLYAAVSSAATLETGTQGQQSRVRLANSVSQNRGRLEVLVDDVWGTVCGNGFDAKAAEVVCHELGYSGGIVYYRAKYGEGDGPIWLTDVNCSGSEKSLFDCEFVVNDTKKCAHYHDVSVACIETPGEGDVRLKDGHLEIYHEGQWGTVCDDHFDENALTVVCRQLGYSHGHFRSDSTVGNGTIWLDDIRCLGHETKLTQCGHKAWGHHDCLHSEDVRLGCERSEGDVRLVDGESAYEGRVEIYKNGAWLALCSENFDTDAASVICSKQGHMEYISIWNDTNTPRVNGTFQLDTSSCGGQEDHLSECLMIGRPLNNCDGNRVAGLTCSPKPSDGALRLVGSERALEIYHEHTWGRLCANSFDSTMAKIACRQMGYSGGTTKREDESYYGDMWKLKNVLCEGYESELIDCSHNGWDTCKRYGYGSRGISLTCDRHRNGLIRLVNGKEPFEGRLEVYFNGEWGTVCDDDFDDNDAEVVCRQLGYNYGEILQAGSHGQGLSSIAMDDVDCSGHELKLKKCAYRGLGEHNCKHDEDVSIRCKLPGGGNLRLSGRTWAYKGVLEIFDRRTEEWVPVSFGSADSKTASVVCRELGYRGGDLTSANRNRDDRSSRFDMDIVCSGYENTLKHCAHDTSGDSSRSNRQVVTVVCDLPENGDVRLADGRSSYDGRIEVYHESKWRKLCTQDDHTALVVCRQLGYTLSEVQEKDFPTAKSKPTLPYTVRCSGHENALTECIKHFEENPKLMCHGIKDMYVQCQHGSRQEDGDLRLVNGNSPNGHGIHLMRVVLKSITEINGDLCVTTDSLRRTLTSCADSLAIYLVSSKAAPRLEKATHVSGLMTYTVLASRKSFHLVPMNNGEHTIVNTLKTSACYV